MCRLGISKLETEKLLNNEALSCSPWPSKVDSTAPMLDLKGYRAHHGDNNNLLKNALRALANNLLKNVLGALAKCTDSCTLVTCQALCG